MWIPFISFNERRVNDVVNITVKELTVPIGYYESGSLSVSSGFREAPLVLSFGRDFELTPP